jgi:hypothetical protein
MVQERVYRVLGELAQDATQAKSLVAVCAVFSGSARSFAEARQLAKRGKTRFKSGWQRSYRWVGQSAIDPAQAWQHGAGVVRGRAARGGGRGLDRVASWRSGAGVRLGKRAVPVLAQALSIARIRRGQNAFVGASGALGRPPPCGSGSSRRPATAA